MSKTKRKNTEHVNTDAAEQEREMNEESQKGEEKNDISSR